VYRVRRVRMLSAAVMVFHELLFIDVLFMTVFLPDPFFKI
jgi:hypothetical protein